MTKPNWQRKLELDCLHRLVISGSIGMSRQWLVRATGRHERNVRRAVKSLMQDGAVFIDSGRKIYTGRRPCQILRATAQGAELLNRLFKKEKEGL